MAIRVGIRLKPDRSNYQLYYVDPLTGKDVTRSAGTDNVRKAERAAAKWEAELEDNGLLLREMSWEQFRIYYEDTHLVTLSVRSQEAACTAMNRFEQAIGRPRRISLIHSRAIADVVAKWRQDELSTASIASYLRQLKAAFRWAKRLGLMREVPQFPMLKQEARQMRGRPIGLKEFAAMLRATRSVRPRDWRRWTRFLRGLWYSGLRLQEAIALSWTDPPIRVDLTGGRFPRFVIHARGQKSRRDEIAPMAPDCARWLGRTPPDERTGRVLPVYSLLGDGRPMTDRACVGRIITDIGRQAGILVNETGKHVTAHDLRRSFGTRWALHVKPLTLKRLMRHASIETTLRYYVDQDADDIAEELWAGDLYPRMYPSGYTADEK